MRAVSTIWLAVLTFATWVELANSFLAFPNIHPLVAVFMPLAHVTSLLVLSVLWAYFRYSTDTKSGKAIIDFGMAFFFLAPHVKAMKDLGEGLFVSWGEGWEWSAIIMSTVFPITTAVVFGVLSTWYGQVMPMSGADVRFRHFA